MPIAPIARRVFDYWLTGRYPSVEDIAALQKAQATAPIGQARSMSDLAWPSTGTTPGLNKP